MKRGWIVLLVAITGSFLLSGYQTIEEMESRVKLQDTCKSILGKRAQEVAKEHQLELQNIGLGGFAGAKKAKWSLNLVSHQAMTIEEVRPLIIDIICKMYNLISSDSQFENCLKDNHKVLDENTLAFRLAFWDEKVNRPLFPYLAQVRLADGAVYYHYADPQTQSLQEPIVEPLSALVTLSKD